MIGRSRHVHAVVHEQRRDCQVAGVPTARTTESPMMKAYQKRPNALSRLRALPLLVRRGLATARDSDAHDERGGKCGIDAKEDEQSSIAEWPRYANSFAAPECAKGGEGDADRELDRVFGHPAERAVDGRRDD